MIGAAFGSSSFGTRAFKRLGHSLALIFFVDFGFVLKSDLRFTNFSAGFITFFFTNPSVGVITN